MPRSAYSVIAPGFTGHKHKRIRGLKDMLGLKAIHGLKTGTKFDLKAIRDLSGVYNKIYATFYFLVLFCFFRNVLCSAHSAFLVLQISNKRRGCTGLPWKCRFRYKICPILLILFVIFILFGSLYF